MGMQGFFNHTNKRSLGLDLVAFYVPYPSDSAIQILEVLRAHQHAKKARKQFLGDRDKYFIRQHLKRRPTTS